MGKDDSLEHRTEQSNPFSTGGGGVNYEVCVQSYFVTSMLLEWKLPNIKAEKIEKIKLQGRYAGYDTDDCIIFGDNGNKMLCQIKHSISITKNNKTFADVIKSAWIDFNNNELFNPNNDCINLIVSELTKVDNQSIKSINAWAKTSEDEKEFIQKIYTAKFSSEEKKNKFEVIKYHLSQIKNNITDKEIWEFCKVFNVEILDIDMPNSYIRITFMSALDQLGKEENLGNKIYCYVAKANQNAGTILLDRLKEELCIKRGIDNDDVKQDINKLKEHTNLIFENIHSNVAGITIKREEIEKIENILEKHQMILITGERGIGKSGISKTFFENYCTNTYSIAIRAEEFNHPSIQNVFSGLGLKSSIDDIFSILSLYNEKIIFIESLEKILELENNKAFLEILSILSKNPEWKIICTIRNYAVQQILMNFISDYNIKYDVLDINKFTKEEIDEFIEKVPVLESIKSNNEIFELIKNPFYLSSVYKILNNGYKFTNKDNKETIKSAIWENIIKKNSERIDGLPQKREKDFMQIALKRSKTMKYAVNIDEFDLRTISKLEEDALVGIKEGLVYLTHDVFEDWAIEKYIEKQYQANKDNINKFLNNIGCEQSMCRAYRLWLNEKSENESFIDNYIEDIFNNNELKNIWYDETMAAIIFSDKMDKILNRIERKLFEDDCKLLKRLCFMVRVTAKKPYINLLNHTGDENIVKKSSYIMLKPYGKAWRQIVEFLYIKRNELPNSMNNHCFKILNDWSSTININEKLPPESKEAGLLALYIVNRIKENYYEKDVLKDVFSIAMMTYNSIQNEFNKFIEDTIFNNEARKRHNYIDDIAEQMYSSLYTRFLAKYAPDLLIRVSKREWLVNEQAKEPNETIYHICSSIDEEETYGLELSARCDYFPPSGKREPFRSLFAYFPKKAIDFVIELCNIVAETYIKNSIKNYDEEEQKQILNNIVYEMKKNDGTIIKQYCIANFWSAYRGMSNIPHLIESALMALENNLIEHFEYFKDNKKEIDYCIEYILSNSNSVFTTAVLASVAIPYYKSLGKSALLLLQNNEFYDIDISRSVHEMGEMEPNWFAMNNDVLRKLYVEDRRKAATREWRRETLENLCTKLQFTELKEDVLKIIDELDRKNKNIDKWKFRLNRIDTRKYKFELDEENNQVIGISGQITDKKLLEQVERNTQKTAKMNRFFAISIWANDAKKGKYEFSQFENPSRFIKEIKELIVLYNDLKEDERSILYMTGIIESISIIYAKFKEELTKDEKNWCKQFIINKYMEYDASLEGIIVNGKVDNSGLWSVAEIFSIICEDLEEKEQKELLINGLTCCNLDIRLHTAIGIGKYLWKINSNLADWCTKVVIYFDLLDQSKQLEAINNLYKKEIKNTKNYTSWITEIRKNLIEKNFSEYIVNYEKSSLYSITEKMMMLPKCYDPKNNEIILNILKRIIWAEKDKNDYRKEDKSNNEGYFDLLSHYTDFFGNYFYQMEQNDIEYYLSELENACNNAPDFMRWTLIHYKLLAEKNHNLDRYWIFFNKIMSIMINIAKELKNAEKCKYDERGKMLSEYIYLQTPWQPIDFKNPPISGGIQYICNFVKNANNNIMVFEGISSLMYYFPELILNEGLLTFNELSAENIRKNFEQSRNSIFYLENVLHSYIINLDNNTMPKKIYNICEKILNSLVENASSKAYYTREYLIKSKKIS